MAMAMAMAKPLRPPKLALTKAPLIAFFPVAFLTSQSDAAGFIPHALEERQRCFVAPAFTLVLPPPHTAATVQATLATGGGPAVVGPLRMSSSDGDKVSSKKSKSRGVYARPSAAIERGSGFFVPGLEGSRVRSLFGALVLALAYFNRSVGTGGSAVSEAQSLSDAIAIGFGALLLLQAAVEFAKEAGFGLDNSPGEGASGAGTADVKAEMEQMAQTTSPDLGDAEADAARWVAASYAALTPATHVLLLGDMGSGPTLLYGLGDLSAATSQTTSALQNGISSALETVYDSKGGRVSLPPDHPASVTLLPEEGRRCVLLQRVADYGEGGKSGNRRCLVVGSDRPLPSFTKNDLRWLGRLGEYMGRQ